MTGALAPAWTQAKTPAWLAWHHGVFWFVLSSSEGPTRADFDFQTYPGRVNIHMHMIFTFPTPNAKWCSGKGVGLQRSSHMSPVRILLAPVSLSFLQTSTILHIFLFSFILIFLHHFNFFSHFYFCIIKIAKNIFLFTFIFWKSLFNLQN